MKRIAQVVFSVLAGLLITFNLNAQSPEWIRVESQTKDLSVTFPPGFMIYNNRKDPAETFKIYGFQNGVVFNLRVFKEDNPKERLKRISFEPNVRAAAFSKNKVDGKMSIVERSGKDFLQSIYLASNKNFYNLQITAPSLKQTEVDRFLLSIKINGEPIFTGNGKYEEAAQIKTFDSIATSPEITEAIERKQPERKPLIEYKKLSEAVSVDMTQYSRPPVILDTPNPKPNFSFGKSSSFAAKLKIELLASGQVGNIVVFSDSDRTFIKSCIEAIKNVRFVPAQINGKNVDSADIVEYNIKTYVTKSVTAF